MCCSNLHWCPLPKHDGDEEDDGDEEEAVTNHVAEGGGVKILGRTHVLNPRGGDTRYAVYPAKIVVGVVASWSTTASHNHNNQTKNLENRGKQIS